MQFFARRVFATCVLALTFAFPAIAQDSPAPSPEAASASATTPTQFVFVPLGNDTTFGLDDRRMQEYQINPATGALTVVKKAFEAQNLTVFTFRDPTHRFLYIAGNGHNSEFSFGEISEYTVNAATGAPALLPGSPFSTSDHQALGFGTIRNDLKFAYILQAQGPNLLHIISMNPATGAMVKEVATITIPSANSVTTLRFDSSGRFLYLAEEEANTIDAFVSDPTTGALTPVPGSPFVPRGAQPGNCELGRTDICGGTQIATTASNHLYYVSSVFNGIAEFSIDPITGALTELPQSPAVIPIVHAGNVHTTPDGRHLYVSSPDSNTITGYTINPATGTLTRIPGSSVTVHGSGDNMEIDATGNFLYSANGDTLSGFKINSATGLLTTVPGSPYSAPGNTGISIIHK